MPSVWRTTAQTGGTATNLTQINITNSSYTVAFWARSLNTGGGDLMRHASTANNARDGYAFSFNSSELVARHYNATAASNYPVLSGSPLQVGIWRHYAIVYSGGVALGFINGELVNRAAAANAPTANASCTTTLTPNITGTYNGNLFDFQILPNVAVPIPDVKTLMNPRYKHPDVKARWFGLEFPGYLANETLLDESGNNSNLTVPSTARLMADVEPPYLPTLA